MFQNWQNKFFYEANTGADGGTNPTVQPTATTAAQPTTGTAAEKTTFTKAEVDEMLKGRMTQDDVNRIVSERVKRESEKKAKEIEEAQKLAQMSESERAAAELKKAQDIINEYKTKEFTSQLKIELQSKGLPADIANHIKASDAESAKNSIDFFKKLIDGKIAEKDAKIKELEQQLTNANLRGTTPKAVTGTPGEITPQEFNKMGYANRLEIKNKNPELYNKLTNKK